MRTLVLSLAALLAASAAQAADDALALADSPALRCLTPPAAERGKPVYPEDLDTLKLGAVVKVELRFDGPDERPQVAVLGKPAEEGFVRAVEQHVRQLRVPCMKPGEAPVRLLQEYAFSPTGQRIHAGAPSDAADAQRRKQMGCVTRENPKEEPAYPYNAQQAGEQGRVLLLLRFVSADGPPEVQSFAGYDQRRLSRHAVNWAKGYRMPCLTGSPVEATWSFLYRLGGDLPPVFKDQELLPFLRAVKGIETQQLDFDFNQMACPFAVEIHYFKPHLPNRVGQVGSTHPARQPFLDWLSGVELQLPPQYARQMLGDSLFLKVPCTVLQLGPSAPAAARKG